MPLWDKTQAFPTAQEMKTLLWVGAQVTLIQRASKTPIWAQAQAT